MPFPPPLYRVGVGFAGWREGAATHVGVHQPADELRTMFVETDVVGECNDGTGRLLTECSVIEFVSKHAGLQKYGVTEEMAREKLREEGRRWRRRL